MVMTAYDETWRAEQSKTIGGSSAAAVMGKARFKTARDLWDVMHGSIVEGRTPGPLRETDDMHRGSVFEPIARQLLAEELGVSIHEHDQCRFMQRDSLPWAHCLPDGWIGSDLIAELKVPRPGTIAKVNLQGLLDEWLIQAQHNIAVCGARACHIGLLDPMSARLHHIQVSRDDAFIEGLMRAEMAFFDSIKAEKPPDATELPDLEDSTDKLILDNDEARAIAETFFRLKEIVEDANVSLEVAKDKLKTMGGDAPVFEIPGLARFWHKPAKPRQLFQKALALIEFPALAEARFYKDGRPSRPFKPFDLRKD